MSDILRQAWIDTLENVCGLTCNAKVTIIKTVFSYAAVFFNHDTPETVMTILAGISTE